MEKVNVAVVGVTGAVGEKMLAILEQRNFPADRVDAVASARSAGRKVRFREQELEVQDLAGFDFSDTQIGLFSPGASVSKQYAPIAASQGCVVVDNTSQFRYDDDIPLVVPEVNAHQVSGYTTRGIIANPNCSTIQMVVALKPIHDAVGISRVNVATYQAVSGTGKEAIEELDLQTRKISGGEPVSCEVYPKQIAFNALPHIDVFLDNGYTKEEMKMVWETRKIMEDETLLVNPTTVRIPVVNGHSEAVHLELKEPLSASRARQLLADAPGICVLDRHEDGGYPTAVTEGDGSDAVYVGRIREDISHPRGLNMWVVSDNLRKGAALNSIQIAEILVREYL
ncbi:MAG: aspartate-semialdehyde dehydrogenase [Gammaproteobacteria bacterium]|nr:aspartate-semialdehyde dehydrogenase [Gammaproteobacteria bacterium]MDE0411838.1 aspartate-semialdehyde dehydrogenase [Gammaproteobacteria bacterium]